MSHKLNEQQVLEELSIPDFRHLSKDKIMSFVSIIDKVDPEVAKKAIEQIPDFANMSIDALSELKETTHKALDDDKDSTDRFYKMCDDIIDAIRLSMSDGVVTFEEKKYCIDKMQEIAKMASDKDSESKKFKWAVLGTFATVAVAVISATAAVLGANIDIDLPIKKD